MKFKDERAQTPKPDRIVVLPIACFVADWQGRKALGNTPTVAVGLRKICDMDVQAARAEASKSTLAIYADEKGKIRDAASANASYSDLLIRHAMSRAMCDPNDASRSFFAFPDEATVKQALSTDAIVRLWDEYVLMTRTTGVEFAKASDDDLERLARALFARGVLTALPEGTEAEVRKMALWVLNQLVAAGVDIPEAAAAASSDTEDGDGDEEGIYRITVPAMAAGH